MYLEIWQNCCAICAAVIGVFVFTAFLNGVNVVSPSMPHVLSL
jgi:hypothetical protein